MTGLEPATFSLGSCRALDVNHLYERDNGHGRNDLAEYSADFLKNNSDLAKVVEAWDKLPEAIRVGIIALVDSFRIKT